MLLRTADPPSLPRKTVRLAHDEHGKLRLPAPFRLVIDKAQDLAQGAHLRARKMMPKQSQDLGIADRFAGASRGNENRPHLRRVGKEPGALAHRGCWLKSTGVSSNTSSFDVL